MISRDLHARPCANGLCSRPAAGHTGSSRRLRHWQGDGAGRCEEALLHGSAVALRVGAGDEANFVDQGLEPRAAGPAFRAPAAR